MTPDELHKRYREIASQIWQMARYRRHLLKRKSLDLVLTETDQAELDFIDMAIDHWEANLLECEKPF